MITRFVLLKIETEYSGCRDNGRPMSVKLKALALPFLPFKREYQNVAYGKSELGGSD
jgi:hypothetical protein